MFNKTIIVFILIVVSCTLNEKTKLIPQASQRILEAKFPTENPFNEAKFKLGEKLFFDPVLSHSGKLSCASCHIPEFAFSDTVALSPGTEQALNPRNTPPLMNIGFHSTLMWDGGLLNLESQVLVPFGDDGELEMSIREASEKISSDSDYLKGFKDVFGLPPNPFTITQAIACYERTLISSKSRFDKFLADSDSFALNDQEIRGWNIFSSEKTNCAKCHNGPLLTNLKFENIGLYAKYRDPGRKRITDRNEDEGKFKVPTLRNISLTAPYMHDGSIATLEEVIEFYASGGKAHPNKSTLIHETDLSHSEKEDLVAFLRCLVDDNFIHHEKVLISE